MVKTIIFLCFIWGRAQTPEFTFKQADRTELLAFSEKDNLLAAEANDIDIYETKTGNYKTTVKKDFFANSMTFAPDGEILGTGNNDGKIRLFDTKNFSLLKTFSVTKWSIYALAFSADSKLLAADGADGTVQIWNTVRGEKIQTLGAKAMVSLRAIAFSPKGNYLATYNSNSELGLWNLKSGKKVFSVVIANQSPLTFCRNGKELAVTNFTGVKFLNTQNGEIIKTHNLSPKAVPFTKHSGGGYFHGKVIISPDCKTLAVTNLIKKNVVILDLNSSKVRKILSDTGLQESSYVGNFSPDGKIFATGSTRGNVRVWRIK